MVMRWLRRFFYSDDPVVRLVGGLSEPEAGMVQEALQREGVAAMSKNMDALRGAYGEASTIASNSHDLFVKRSDLERAGEIAEALLPPQKRPYRPEDPSTS